MIAIEYMDHGDKEEILEAIGAFAEQVDVRLDKLESRLTHVEATMVTKSYLDDKLGDLKGDMVALVRKEDQKMNRLIGVLVEKAAVTPTEVKDVLSFRPFP